MLLAAELTWADAARLWGGLVAVAGGIGVLLAVPGVGPWLRRLYQRNVTQPRHDRLAATIAAAIQPIDTRMAAVEGQVAEINDAVNHVGPGGASLSARLDRLDRKVDRLNRARRDDRREQREQRELLDAFLEGVQRP